MTRREFAVGNTEKHGLGGILRDHWIERDGRNHVRGRRRTEDRTNAFVSAAMPIYVPVFANIL